MVGRQAAPIAGRLPPLWSSSVTAAGAGSAPAGQGTGKEPGQAGPALGCPAWRADGKVPGMAPGPLALVGSGEYLPAMLDIERELIAGRPPRYVQIPTAAAAEGRDRLDYWVQLGRAQAQRLGVDAVPLVVTDRAQADDPAVAAEVAGAGLIYLSGGNPALLADILRGTALWSAIVAAWSDGAALAGCSAGAMVMGDRIPQWRRPAGGDQVGLGVVPGLRVLPHFDRMLGRMPDLLTRPFLRSQAGVTVVGIDERTALVGGPSQFVVQGHQSVWLLGNGQREEIKPGGVVRFGG
jgi:peptidase E